MTSEDGSLAGLWSWGGCATQLRCFREAFCREVDLKGGGLRRGSSDWWWLFHSWRQFLLTSMDERQAGRLLKSELWDQGDWEDGVERAYDKRWWLEWREERIKVSKDESGNNGLVHMCIRASWLLRIRIYWKGSALDILLHENSGCNVYSVMAVSHLAAHY